LSLFRFGDNKRHKGIVLFTIENAPAPYCDSNIFGKKLLSYFNFKTPRTFSKLPGHFQNPKDILKTL
jgi:hypothetical protein